MHKSNKAIIVANGDIKDPVLTYKRITTKFGFSADDIIISADGGAKNSLEMNLIPDVVIGDMDSIKKETKAKLNLGSKKIKYISSPAEKDKTDTHLAVEHAINLGTKKIIITGATGDRLDHSLANLIMLSSPFLKDIDIRILTDDSEIFVVRNSCSIKGEVGNIISLFSLSPYTFFVKTSGLKYKLENEKLLFSPVRGICNVFTEHVASIEIKKGILLVIKQL